MDNVDLTVRMECWRRGELSNGEMLTLLLNAQAEIILEINKDETKTADERWAKLGA